MAGLPAGSTDNKGANKLEGTKCERFVNRLLLPPKFEGPPPPHWKRWGVRPWSGDPPAQRISWQARATKDEIVE